MADPPSKADSGFPVRQNQPFPTPANCFMGNPQLTSTNSSNMTQNPMQIPNLLQNPVMPVPNMPQSTTAPVLSGAASNFGPFRNNQLVPPQMGLLGSTSQMGQFGMGFNHGNSVNNVNSAALLALFGQIMQNSAQVYLSQSQGQLFNPAFMNGPQQQQNMHMNMPNGHGVMQNLSQIMSMQGINPSQVAPCAFLPFSQPVLGVPNQNSQGIIPQVANFNTNPHFGVGQCNQAWQLFNQNSGNFVSYAVGGNGLSPTIFQSQLQGNASDPPTSGLFQNMRPSAIAIPEGDPSHSSKNVKRWHIFKLYKQGDPIHSSKNDNLESNWGNFPCKKFMKKPVGGEFERGCRKFTKKPNGGQFDGRFQKFNSHNMNDGGGKLGFPDMHTGKGSNMKRRRKFDCDTSTPGNMAVARAFNNYSEEEIRQWRESRRNNYPSKQNLEKKQRAKLDHSELTCRDTQLKNELAEVLSKQAKLGVEVAELAPEYLLDPVQQGQRNEDTKMSSNKDRNRNKFNKRQGFNKQDRFSKKQKFDNGMISNDDTSRSLCEIHPVKTGSGAALPSNYTHHTANRDPASKERNKLSTKETANSKFNKIRHNKKGRFDKKQKLANTNQRENCPTKREPTLLQKLLCADIRRDKGRLLHVFRFMVMNSFFKDWPDKPLIHPSVIIDGVKHECNAEESVSLSEVSSKQVGNNISAEEFVCSNRNIGSDKEDEDADEDLDENCTKDPNTVYAIVKEECNDEQSEETDQEEGEIVD